MHEYHPFSIIDAPVSRRRSRITIEFAIRDDGDFTRQLGLLPAGEQVDMLEPYGRYRQFIEEHPRDASIVLVAGGIGITPLLSVFERYGSRVATFVYTARHGQLLPVDRYLRHHALRTGTKVIIAEHRINPERITDVNQHATMYLIAGPMAMQRAWRRHLCARGVPADDVYYEPFAW